MTKRRRIAHPPSLDHQDAFWWVGHTVTIQRADQLSSGVWLIKGWSRSRGKPIVLLLGSPGGGARVKNVQEAAKPYLSSAERIEQRDSLLESLRRRRRDNDLPDGRAERIDLSNRQSYRTRPATNREVAEWMNQSFWMTLGFEPQDLRHREVSKKHQEADARDMLRSLGFGEQRAAKSMQEALEVLRNGDAAPKDVPLTKDDIAQALRIRGKRLSKKMG